MERRVTVNDRIERLKLEPPEGLDPLEGEPAEFDSGMADTGLVGGACLYLGPQGERCGRPASEGGFCARHHLNPELRSSGRNYSRVVLATFALLGVLWPYLIEAARELSHWLAEAK